jgi:glutamate/tyrosine decarboxylase-like PLP-dependent enzyme
MRPDPLLFPASDDRRIVEDQLTLSLIEALEQLPARSVTPSFDIEAFGRELAAYNFNTPCPLDGMLSWTIQHMQHGLVHVNHPRYFGLFNPRPAFPAECADRITAAFNPQLATRTTSPAAVQIEAHVINVVGRRAGFSAEATGHFTSGGSEANYTALVCALNRNHPEFAEIGARAFVGHPVFYVSRDCHLAWVKIAQQAGIGRQSVRFVQTDGTGRLDALALASMIAADRAAGSNPIMIVATAGTTNAGMIDPLEACADLATINGLWLHVDAAWGGALIASDQQRNLVEGMRRADSITIDAHKWFSTTMGCGMFLTPHGAILSRAFEVVAGFMPSNFAEFDPFLTTAQWSRRFSGLRLFLTLGAVGWTGYGDLVDSAILLATRLSEGLIEKGWTIMNASSAAVVCGLPPKGSKPPRALVDRVLESGRAWCSVASFEGQDVIRCCISNGMSTADDVDILLSELAAAC